MINLKPGVPVRLRIGKRETGTIEWVRWNWHHMTTLASVKVDPSRGGGVVICRLGDIQLIENGKINKALAKAEGK